MQVKERLSLRAIGTARFGIGLTGGIAFATFFYLASYTVARATTLIIDELPAGELYYIELGNEELQRFGLAPRPVPILTRSTVETVWWMSPFWAGLSAAFGQALMLTIWFLRPRLQGSIWRGRQRVHMRSMQQR